MKNSKAVCFFSHGLADTSSQAYRYTPDFIPFPIYTFNYNYARFFPSKIPKISQVSLAQYNELICFIREFDLLESLLQLQYKNDYQIVLYGVSRGASVILLFLALFPEKLTHISCIILESPFDSVETILKNKIKSISFFSFDFGQTVLEFIFGKYTRTFAAPRDFVFALPRNIPMLFVYSEKDSLVPKESTLFLYEQCINYSFTNVSLFVAHNAQHSKIIHTQPDSEMYKNTLKIFFKKCVSSEY